MRHQLFPHSDGNMIFSEIQHVHTCTKAWLVCVPPSQHELYEKVNDLLIQLATLVSRMELVGNWWAFHSESEMFCRKWGALRPHVDVYFKPDAYFTPLGENEMPMKDGMADVAVKNETPVKEEMTDVKSEKKVVEDKPRCSAAEKKKKKKRCGSKAAGGKERTRNQD